MSYQVKSKDENSNEEVIEQMFMTRQEASYYALELTVGGKRAWVEKVGE